MSLVLALFLRATVLFALQGSFHLDLVSQFVVIVHCPAKTPQSFHCAHQHLMDTVYHVYVLLDSFTGMIHALYAIFLDVTLAFIVEYALQTQTQSAWHALTSKKAIKHYIYQLANQQMQTTVSGYASLSVMNAVRCVCCLFEFCLSAPQTKYLLFASSI